MWTLVSKQNASTTCKLHQFFCVAFFFEHLSCFNKNKQEITHYGCFNIKHETLSSYSLIRLTLFCNKMNITVSFPQSSILTKFVCLFTSSLTFHILRLLLTKVAAIVKLFSTLISYFNDSSQTIFGLHTAPTVARRSVMF